MKAFVIKTFIEFTKFSFVGIAALFLYIFLTFLLKFNGMDVMLSSSISYLLSIGLSYLGQRFFTFNAKNVTFINNISFLLISILGLAFSSLGFLVLNTLNFNEDFGVLITVIFVPIMNYVLMKKYVFNKTNT